MTANTPKKRLPGRTLGRTMTGLSFVMALLISIPGFVHSQEAKRYAGTSRFVMTGYGDAKYELSQENAGENSFKAGLNPIFLYMVGDKLLFETELEIELEETSTEFGLEYAQVDWFLHNNLTLVAGKFLTPFGTFIEKLHPSWINKLPSSPLGWEHGTSFVPMSQVGVQLRGVFPLAGYSKLTLTAYGSNGVSFSTATAGHHGGAGLMVDNEDSNKNKFFGGRVGVIPTKGVEIGVSLLSGKSTQILGEDVVDNGLNLTLWGLDAEVHGEVWEVRGEYVNSKKQQIHDTAEGIEKEEKNAFYVQAATRLSIIPAGFFVGALTPWEAVVRYSVTTEKAHDAGAHDETFNTVSFGLNYYITDSAVAKLGYDVKNEPHDEKTRNDMLTAMLSIGF